MPSPVEIANIALSNIGAENLVSSIDPPDGSVEAGYCATFYPIARTVLLEAVKPSFAKKRATLAEEATNPSAWAYAYAKPSDCLRPLRLLPAESLASIFADDDTAAALLDRLMVAEADSARFEAEGNTILCDVEDAVLIYVFDQTDTTKWTPLFADAVAAMLSSYLAGPIIKGKDGAALGQQWRAQAYRLGAAAAATVANSTDEPAEHIPDHIRARA